MSLMQYNSQKNKQMKIGILCGGHSAEREVSLKSGQYVYQSLIDKGFDCCLIDVDFQHLERLWQQSFNYAFILLHGKGGEDGQIQAELTQKNIPFSGSNSMVSKICMDKLSTKQVWQQHKLLTAEFVLSKKGTQLGLPNFALPWIIKPTTEGSSLGISKVNSKLALKKALKIAHQYDSTVLIERFLKGKEYTIGLYEKNGKLKALPIIEIAHNLDFLDYHNKYFDNEVMVKHYCPAPLDKHFSQYAQDLAFKAFKVLGCKDWARIDFIIENGQIYLIEVNNVPGMTPASLIPIALKAVNIPIADFVLGLIKNN